MPKTWYAVHTIAGHENKVKDVLTRRAQVEGFWQRDIYEILIPTEREMTTRGGKRYEVEQGRTILQALDDIEYHGWATAEVAGGGEKELREVAERMNRVLALS